MTCNTSFVLRSNRLAVPSETCARRPTDTTSLTSTHRHCANQVQDLEYGPRRDGSRTHGPWRYGHGWTVFYERSLRSPPSRVSQADGKQMIFTWSSKNLCIIFEQWQITGTWSLIWSLIAIVILTAGYECLRQTSRKYEQAHEARMSAFSSSATSTSIHPGQVHCH